MQEATQECKIGGKIDSHRSPLLPSPDFLPYLEGALEVASAGSSEQCETGWIVNSHTRLWYLTWWILSLMGPLGCRKTPAMYRSRRKCSTAINRGEITRELPLAWYRPATIWTGAFFSSIYFDFPPHFLSRLNVTTLWEDLTLLLTLIAS